MGLSGLQKGVCLHVTAQHAESLFLDVHLCSQSLGGHPPASLDQAGAPPPPRLASIRRVEWGLGGGSGAGCSVAEVDLGSWEVETKASQQTPADGPWGLVTMERQAGRAQRPRAPGACWLWDLSSSRVTGRRGLDLFAPGCQERPLRRGSVPALKWTDGRQLSGKCPIRS